VVDSLPSAADARHLSAALQRSGVLGVGRVRDVVIEHSRTTVLSRIVRLRLSYDGAAVDAPSTVIFKTGLPERAGASWHAGRQEVAFYTQVAPLMPTRLVPRCFDALWDATANAWYLLLEDLTDSHVIATPWPLPPTLEQCVSIIQARAHFHAQWWDDARLGTSAGTWTGPHAMNSHLNTLAERFVRFADRLGGCLDGERRTLYERFFAAAPRLLARYYAHRNLTIVHGDAHVWNTFLPRDGSGQDVRFFDWDCWRVDLGSDALAYMMALHWYPDLRRRFEPSLLDRYHEALVAHGVQGYDRRALQEDYRLSVLWQMATPVWQAANDIPPVIWWNNFERIMLAVDDLGCRELLA
jgi:hypothetical protein